MKHHPVQHVSLLNPVNDNPLSGQIIPPPPPVEADPYQADATMLPTQLWDALDALARDSFYRGAFGDVLVDYVLMMKRSEVGRFLSEVTDWEQREYFEVF